MAVVSHRGPSAQDSPHVDHGAFAHHSTDIEDGPHHDDGTLADLHLLPNDGPGFDPGLEIFQVQQGHAGVPAVVLHHAVGDLLPVVLQDGRQLGPVPKDDAALSLTEHFSGSEVHRSRQVDVNLYWGLLGGICDIVDDFLCIQSHHAPNKIFCRS